MKTTHFAWTCTALLLTWGTLLFSQQNTMWIGGTPGQESVWECAQNWSTGLVPNENSNVIIPSQRSKCFGHPTIHRGQVRVNALFLHPQAQLIVLEEAELIVIYTAEGLENVQGKASLLRDGPLNLDPHHHGQAAAVLTAGYATVPSLLPQIGCNGSAIFGW